jgi:hypothetical protein
MTFAGLLSRGIFQNSASDRQEMSAPESYRAAACTRPYLNIYVGLIGLFYLANRKEDGGNS